MKTIKISTLFLVSILAIAGIGISLAGWTDTISVTGTIQTGQVNFKVTGYSGTWAWKHFADGNGKALHELVVHSGPVAEKDLKAEDIDAVLIATDHDAVDYVLLTDLEVPILDTRNAMHGIETAEGQVWKA